MRLLFWDVCQRQLFLLDKQFDFANIDLTENIVYNHFFLNFRQKWTSIPKTSIWVHRLINIINQRCAWFVWLLQFLEIGSKLTCSFQPALFLVRWWRQTFHWYWRNWSWSVKVWLIEFIINSCWELHNCHIYISSKLYYTSNLLTNNFWIRQTHPYARFTWNQIL